MKKKKPEAKIAAKKQIWIERTSKILGVGEDEAMRLLTIEKQQSIRVRGCDVPLGIAGEISTDEQYVITLAPRLEIVQSQRGERVLSEWEKQRIQYHYDTGVASPKFGITIDNSDLSVEQTVDKIMQNIDKY